MENEPCVFLMDKSTKEDGPGAHPKKRDHHPLQQASNYNRNKGLSKSIHIQDFAETNNCS